MTTKICRNCKENKPLDQFRKDKYYVSGYTRLCLICARLVEKTYTRSTASVIAGLERTRKYRIEKRNEALMGLGNKCEHCGERRREFLSIDHVNDDGYIERKDSKYELPMLVIKSGFDKSKYQILCYNCNMSKAHYKRNPILIERELREQHEGMQGEGI